MDDYAELKVIQTCIVDHGQTQGSSIHRQNVTNVLLHKCKGSNDGFDLPK